MIHYKYKAVSVSGKAVDGIIEAYSEFEAVDMIRKDYPIVESITEVKEKFDFAKLNEPFVISEKILSLTCNQFSILMKAGIPMVRVLNIISEQSSDNLIKKIFRGAAGDVEAGHSLANSLEKNGQKLPITFIETVRAGEESGTLEQSFQRLSTYYEKAHKIKQKVKAAMIYPTAMIFLAIIVIAVVMIKLVPSMMSSFSNLDMELPALTRGMMAVSDFFRTKWIHMLMVCTVLGIFFVSYKKTHKGEIQLAKIALKLPVLGSIACMNSASQFANTMSTLLAAGLPATKCLTILSNILDNKAVGIAVGAAVPKVEEGKRIGEAMADNPYLPKLLIEMTAVGEESGSLEETLSVIGVYYDSEAETAAAKALAMLEPAITMVLGVFVAIIVASIYLPMFQMYSGMG